MASKINFAIIAAFVLFLAGCGGERVRPLYYWNGAYSTAIYKQLKEEGADANEQINSLLRLIELSTQKGYAIAPGVFSHLGLLYASVGNFAQASSSFDKETQLYPESKEYMEFLKSQMLGIKASKTEQKGESDAKK